jgi:hypothetical protein
MNELDIAPQAQIEFVWENIDLYEAHRRALSSPFVLGTLHVLALVGNPPSKEEADFSALDIGTGDSQGLGGSSGSALTRTNP